ncbi:MAG: peptidyl-prolyl cis-trans isomerase [Polyangiaceae bacterium]
MSRSLAVTRRQRLYSCRPIVALACSIAVVGCVVTPLGSPGDPPRTAIVVRESSNAGTAANLPSEIGASHLLVQYVGAQSAPASVKRSKAEARHRAEEALARARNGEDFGTLVSEYSDEPGAAERKGALGKFPHHAMVKPFADAAFRLKIGEISDVVESQFGFHVILRTE